MAEPKPKEDRKQDKPNKAFENFQELAKKLMSVPKEDVDRQREKQEREKRVG